MTGELTETHYGVVREKATSPQMSIVPEPTYIAVVREPRDTKIDDYCDEWMPSLGMPRPILEELWSTRKGYTNNINNPHERAVKAINLPGRYRGYLETDEPQEAIEEITDRLQDGENISLVCFEESGYCHRHDLKSEILSRIPRFVF